MVSMSRGSIDMGMDDFGFFNHQFQENTYEELIKSPFIPTYVNNSQHVGSNQIDNQSVLERPTKQIKMNNWNIPQESSSKILSFGSSKPSTHVIPEVEGTHFVVKSRNSSNSARITQTKEHTIAERKRREKLSEKFIALSAVLPGLKKMDKASVLGHATKYLKHLQDRVKELEEDTKRKEEESAVLVKRTIVISDDDKDPISGQQTVSNDSRGESFPEIEARFSSKDVLIRIHCEKKRGILEELIERIETLHLVVINSSSLAFGSSALDVTIIAQMGDEFSQTAEDIVRHLHATLQHLI